MIVLYLCGLIFSMMIPNQILGTYNPNATYVPVIASIGYYSTPAVYKRAHCVVIDHGEITHSVVSAEEYYCGPRVQLDVVLSYFTGKDWPPIQPCANLSKNGDASMVYCMQDEEQSVMPWCAVRLRQNVTHVADVVLNVTGPYIAGKSKLFHSRRMQIKGVHEKLPAKAGCDYLTSDDGSITEAYLELYEYARSNHSYASGFVIGFLVMSFIVWSIGQ
jgi:hypothetical protein